jgi:outer membrane protein TolC
MSNSRGIGKIKRITVAALAAILIIPAAVFAQTSTLDIAEVLRLVSEQNAGIQIAEALELQAEALHRQTLADTKPQIDLQLDPVYGYSRGIPARVQYISPPGPEDKTDVSLGLSLTQTLPTAGFASLSLANTTSFTRNPSTVSQNPSATFVLSQPVWVNGKLIDLRQLSAAQKISEVNWKTAAHGSLEARNSNIYIAFNLYAQVIGLRRNIAYLEKSLELADQNLRQVRINLDAGRAAETDLLELEILIGLQREALLDSQYALLQAGQSLADTLGLKDGLASYEFIDSFRTPSLPDDTQVLIAEARTKNPTVRQDRLSVEQAQAQTIMSGRTDAPNLSITLTLLPQYEGAKIIPAVPPEDFAESFSSLFSDGAELDWSISIGLEVPLYNGGKASYREQANGARERIARETLDASLRNVQNTYEALILRQRIIQDRIVLLEKNIQLKIRTAADEEKKLEVGLGTPFRVESARLELLQVQNELWQAQADLFLNTLDLLNLSGRSLEDLLVGL